MTTFLGGEELKRKFQAFAETIKQKEQKNNHITKPFSFYLISVTFTLHDSLSPSASPFDCS